METRWSGSSLRESRIAMSFGKISDSYYLVFSHRDDDTFFPDFDSLIRLLSSFSADEDKLIGTLSESTKQVSLISLHFTFDQS